MNDKKQVISLELNELNFELIELYVAEGKLPTFKKLLQQHGYRITESESVYEHIEPWIQWVTVHTGKRFSEHNVFRLGEIKGKGYEQIWETLERMGLRVAAMSPMNAENRLKDPVFFVPDPWTKGQVSGSPFLSAFYGAVSQAVNDNATSGVNVSSLAILLAGLARFASPKNYATYISLARSARQKKWNKALILDLLLADCFRLFSRQGKPHYATLFLNAAAHVQHHYMFSSKHVNSSTENPEWYVPAGCDPVLEVYELYDQIVNQMIADYPGARLQLLTGLHQTAYPKTTYYWRLKNHEQFLRKFGLNFSSVEPRMSRDFLVLFATESATIEAEKVLQTAAASNAKRLFTVDRRGKEIFVELVFDQDVTEDLSVTIGHKTSPHFKEDVAFVAIKNGHHDGDGYILDTARNDIPTTGSRVRLPLRGVFNETIHMFE